MSNFLQWITNNFSAIELFGAISALLYIILEIKQHWIMWIIGFISSSVYVLIFLHAKLYANMGLNLYYVIMAIYGLYYWRFAKTKNKSNIEIKHITNKLNIILTFITIILLSIVSFIQYNFTDSSAPFYDSIIAVLSIIATWMVARKIVEHWLLWIMVNFLSVGLYYWQELYITSGLYIIYGTMSIIGWIQWKKSMKPENRKKTINT